MERRVRCPSCKKIINNAPKFLADSDYIFCADCYDKVGYYSEESKGITFNPMINQSQSIVSNESD